MGLQIPLLVPTALRFGARAAGSSSLAVVAAQVRTERMAARLDAVLTLRACWRAKERPFMPPL